MTTNHSNIQEALDAIEQVQLRPWHSAVRDYANFASDLLKKELLQPCYRIYVAYSTMADEDGRGPKTAFIHINDSTEAILLYYALEKSPVVDNVFLSVLVDGKYKEMKLRPENELSQILYQKCENPHSDIY